MSTGTRHIDYLEELNAVQRQAVTTTDGPVLVVAGPGSGKTRVLTYRVAYLIEQGVLPWQILALTFTNKAAREMKARIESVVGDRANQIWAGTFHSLFARILRVEAEHIGYPANFTIYDTDDSKSLINNIVKRLNLDKNTYNTNSIRQRISSAKSKLITPKRYTQNQDLLAQDRQANMPRFHEIYTEYAARCKQAGAMDFDDLLYRLYELLQSSEEVADKYRKKFRYVMVDEFQDTNQLQYAIIRKLVQYPDSPRNICVVGDDAQSIYAFRGATIQNILDFEKDFKAHGIQVFKLEQNYRSTEYIVSAANEVITFNKRQIQKKIWSDKGEGQKIKVIRTMDDNEEGRRVADTILEQKNRHHLANRDIAILYRTNAQSRTFEEYLRRYNIPYRVYGGQSFYQRKEIKDLLGYLRLVVNPQDEEAFRRVINQPKRGIGDSSVTKLFDYAQAKGWPVWDVLPHVDLPKRTRNSLDGFIELIETARKKMASANAYEVAEYVAKRSGLVDQLRNDTSIEGQSRSENLEALLNGIQAFVDDDTVIDTDTLPDKSLATYLQNIALLTDFDEKAAEAADGRDPQDVVTLMSVHAAKGLEFKSVFVVGLEEKLFPSFMSMETIEGLDEERRLFYVAITRAEQFLTLSYANTRYRFGKVAYNEPSRFLAEVPAEALETTYQVRRGSESEQRTRPHEEMRARVTGVQPRKRYGTANPLKPVVDPKTFQPSPQEKIVPGAKVLHLKFGEGKVTSVDGGADNRIATIYFNGLDQPEKRIMLRFAKLQVLN
jgi:DNA helicase-2/ATP-dependent DNA helicase PcrA